MCQPGHIVAAFGEIVDSSYAISLVWVDTASVHEHFLSFCLVAVIIFGVFDGHVTAHAVAVSHGHNIEYIEQVAALHVDYINIVCERHHIDDMPFGEFSCGEVGAQASLVGDGEVYASGQLFACFKDEVGEVVQKLGLFGIECLGAFSYPQVHQRVHAGSVWRQCFCKVFVGIAVIARAYGQQRVRGMAAKTEAVEVDFNLADATA